MTWQSTNHTKGVFAEPSAAEFKEGIRRAVSALSNHCIGLTAETFGANNAKREYLIKLQLVMYKLENVNYIIYSGMERVNFDRVG